MTLLSRTCFSAVAVLASVSAATVSGSVQLMDSREPAVSKKKDYSGVVVWLEPAASVSRVRPEPRRATMSQKNKTFTPHVLAVTAGSTVEFPNFDPIFHNAFSNYDGKVFDVGLYPPGSTRSVRFERPGIVRVFCNIHATMSAIIAVLNTPWFDVTGKDGKYTLRDVPEGEYAVRVFHERATPATLQSLVRRVAVPDEDVALDRVSISESGYLPIPHKNKYGHVYPPDPDEGGVYPAVRP
jgi:plastocyanin